MHPDWSPTNTFLFRWIATWFVAFLTPLPQRLIVEIGEAMGLEVWIGLTGSGDTLFDWLSYGVRLVVSLVFVVIWTAKDGLRGHYPPGAPPHWARCWRWGSWPTW